MADKKQYDDNQLIDGAALIAGTRDFPALELPEIEVDGNPSVIFFKPLSVEKVFKFHSDRALLEKEQDRRKEANEEPVSESDMMLPLHELIAESVVGRNGITMIKKGDVTKLDIRIFNRLAAAVTNIINGRAADYVAPKAPEEPAPLGNGSGEVKLAENSSASPIA